MDAVTAQVWQPRWRLVAVEDPDGRTRPLLVVRAAPDERHAVLSVGHPFFTPRAGGDRIGVWLSDSTDWEEIREPVTESCRILAPKKLVALLDRVAAPAVGPVATRMRRRRPAPTGTPNASGCSPCPLR